MPIASEEWLWHVRSGRRDVTQRSYRHPVFRRTRKTILNSAIPLRGPEGEITGAFIVNMDITEQRRMEAALRDSETRYRSVVTAMAEGIVIQGSDQGIIACNPSASVSSGSAPIRWRAHVDGPALACDPRRRFTLPGRDPSGRRHAAQRAAQSNVVMGYITRTVAVWISINSQPLFRPDETRPYAV